MQMYGETGSATAQCRACNSGWVCGHFLLLLYVFSARYRDYISPSLIANII